MFELGKVKAEYTILYFWSATCGHCKKTTPKLYEMYKRLKPHGLEIYTVHIDENKKPLKKYLDEHQFTWITTNAPNNEFNYRVYYNVFSTPVIYLLDKNKKIIGKRMDVITLEKILSDKFGVEPPEHIKNATPEKDSHGH
jgi:thiol-disulfide isomerase/thioredoxin